MHDLSATLFVRPETRIQASDRPRPDASYRIVVVHVGELAMHIDGGDEDIAATTSRLIAELESLRATAMTRIAARAWVAARP